MTHPFQSLPSGKAKYVFLPAFVLYLFIQIFFAADGSLKNATAPMSIVSLELAPNVTAARMVIEGWDANQRIHAAFGVGIDYAYILGYANAIALACVWTMSVLKKRAWFGATFGAWFAWGVWIAGVCDMIENAAMMVMLFGNIVDPFPLISSTMATLKFALIILALVYAMYGGAGWLVNKARPS